MKKTLGSVLSKEYALPKSRSIGIILHSFSPFERLLFTVLTLIFVTSSFVLAADVNSHSLVVVPSYGGSFNEGVVGSPRFINPLFAQSDADTDLTQLIYSGLMRATPNGLLVHDLARSHTVSEDGLVYTFFLRDDVSFHDGERVTADDVVFTVKRAQDASLKSPKRGSWSDVIVEKASDTEVIFTLNRPYSPFLENVTLGILPEHIWGNAATEEFTFSQFNIEPIGSGPYRIEHIRRNDSGVPEFYELESFNDYALGRPFIDTIRIYFYSNQDFLIDAFINGNIDAFNGVSAKNLAYAKLNVDNVEVTSVPLPRIFGVFFNQNEAPVFSNIEVRAALNVAIDKERIIEEVLEGFGTAIDTPIPPGIFKRTATTTDEDTEEISHAPKKRAIDILERNGWEVEEESGIWIKKTKKGTERLSFSISTSNLPELKAAGEIIKEEWESIGAEVDLKVFEIGDLNQNAIRPRKYDSLLFGEIVGRELDLFPFWHSSQRNDPGLNIALYANITVDALLEEARTISDRDERIQKFIEFETEIENDIPAVFIYAPDFIYVSADKVGGVELGTITIPSERFLNIHEWYIHTDKVWNFFVN